MCNQSSLANGDTEVNKFLKTGKMRQRSKASKSHGRLNEMLEQKRIHLGKGGITMC